MSISETKSLKEPVMPHHTTGMLRKEVSIDLFGPLPSTTHAIVTQDIMLRISTTLNTSAAHIGVL